MDSTDNLSQPVFDRHTYIVLAISIVVSILIVSINSITIYIIRAVDSLREKYGVLLVAYCLADILNGFHATYLQLRLALLAEYFTSTCAWEGIVVLSIDSISVAMASWFTVLLTLDRYIAICYPFHYNKVMSPKVQKALVAVMCVLSVLETSTLYLYCKTFMCTDMVWQCPLNTDQPAQFIHLTVIFVLHFIMYSRIWWIAHKAKRRSVAAFSDNPPVKRGLVDKATLTVFLVVVLSYVVWIPYFIIAYFYPQITEVYITASVLIGFSGSFINNIIYVIFNKEFHDAFKRLLCYERY